jgi:hypothetical protein
MVRLRRRIWLRKYYTVQRRGAVQWLDHKGQKPTREHLHSGDILVLNQTNYELKALNQSSATVSRSWFGILGLVAATWWFTRNLFF